MLKKEFKVPSSDGIHTLSGVVFEPIGEIRGFFQIAHGMTEYIGRYERFMRDMAKEGYLTFGYDHLGHGATVQNESELGYIAKRDGWRFLARDIGAFAEAVFAFYGKNPQRIEFVCSAYPCGES